MKKNISLLLLCCLLCHALEGQQQIRTHDPELNYQIIQPHEVGSNYQLLKLVDEVFTKNHITYWSWGGTLLGAVRHQGFIPWDFDTDTCIFEDDIDRFLACEKDLKKYDSYILPRDTDGQRTTYRIKRIVNGAEIYGHVDVCIIEKIEDRCIYQYSDTHYFLNSELSEIIRLPFGPIYVNAPVDFMPYLIRGYGEDVMEMAEIMYTVDPNTGIAYPKFEITCFQPAIYEIIDLTIPLDDTPLFPE